jgi:predicted nucleic acid-binding protein
VTVYYADSSALVKRYVNESGSTWIQAICQPISNHIIALAHVGLAEIAAALSVKYRQNVLTADIRDGLLRDLQRYGRDQYWLVDVDQAMVTDAIDLIRRQNCVVMTPSILSVPSSWKTRCCVKVSQELSWCPPIKTCSRRPRPRGY